MGRIFAEKSLVPRMKEHMGEMITRFIQALQNAAPEVPRGEVFWRLQFIGGSMALTLLRGKDLEALSDGLCDTSDVEGALRRLVDFAAAGFRAQVRTPGGTNVYLRLAACLMAAVSVRAADRPILQLSLRRAVEIATSPEGSNRLQL